MPKTIQKMCVVGLSNVFWGKKLKVSRRSLYKQHTNKRFSSVPRNENQMNSNNIQSLSEMYL